MSGEKVAKRQKISHRSGGPSSSSKPKETPVEEPLPSSSDAEEESDNEQTEAAVEETPKTFKELVSYIMSII